MPLTRTLQALANMFVSTNNATNVLCEMYMTYNLLLGLLEASAIRALVELTQISAQMVQQVDLINVSTFEPKPKHMISRSCSAMAICVGVYGCVCSNSRTSGSSKSVAGSAPPPMPASGQLADFSNVCMIEGGSIACQIAYSSWLLAQGVPTVCARIWMAPW